jgi:hypothetical protein
VRTRDADALLAEALPGVTIGDGDADAVPRYNMPGAWKLWRANTANWAAFVVAGDHLSAVDRDAIHRAKKLGFNPVAIIPDFSGVKALAPFYLKLRPYVIHEIAGHSCLISPPKRIPRKRAAIEHITRVPRKLLCEIAGDKRFPKDLRDSLQWLNQRYQAIAKRPKNRDNQEEAALKGYANLILGQMGLRREAIKATHMLRTIEQGDLGAGRDHFFHSYQNYFLGLTALVELPTEFVRFKEKAQLHWDVDPYHVWFLTALWHDVGYSVQKINRIVETAFGYAPEDDTAAMLRQRFLDRSTTQEALRQLSSLLAHVMQNGRPATQWMEPRARTRIGEHAKRLKNAFCRNVLESHGATSALRLWCDYMDDLEQLDPNPRLVLKQTVLLACCSMPFHDWRFRASVREFCGRCTVKTAVLPYAALLSFVDSIQDDRRDISEIKQFVLILRRLLIKRPSTVTADIDARAIAEGEFLSKIIEAHDVLGCLDQAAGELYFKYPNCIVQQ